MGSCLSCFDRSTAEHVIYVKTGDRKAAATDANVKIILHNDQGETSDALTLDNFFRNDFESGALDKFHIPQVPSTFGKITKVEFWRDNSGIGPDWYVEKVLVENRTTKDVFIFPIFRWIKPDIHYVIKHLDCSLPQDDDQRQQRLMELNDKRETYEYTSRGKGMPAQVAKMPSDEEFSFDYKWNIMKSKIQLIAASKIVKLTTGDWESLGHLKNVYTKEILSLPTGANRWSNDLFFGQQRVASCNPSLIRLCTAIPEKLGVDDDVLRPFLEGWKLQQVIEAKRLYMVDLDIMKDLPTKDPKYKVTAPIALFLVNQEQQLVPIAIQLFQDKGPDNPVFLPTDPPYVWMLAKMWYNLADSSFHQSCTHLGLTHLLMEGVAVATHRNLSHSHPVFKLLAPHFLYLIAINTRGLELLVSEGGWVDTTMNIGIKGMFELIARGEITLVEGSEARDSASRWRMNVEGTLPEDLNIRGVNSVKSLPCYPFRDDALLLYHAIKSYVSKYVNLYYVTPDKLSEDHEIQAWVEELCKPTDDKGVGLKGVPGDGKFTTNEQLILTLTSVIYTCSVGHASANFPQYDEYAFPPNYPAHMRGDPPKDKSSKTEKDVLTTLPDKPTTLDIMVVTKVLSGRGTKKLGDFEVQYIYDPPARKIVDEFRDDLKKIGLRINERNKTRNPPYLFLEPDLVPNSISI